MESTFSADIDKLIETTLDGLAIHTNRELYRDLFTTTIRLAQADTHRLDVKIADAALAEMQRAFKVFEPYADVPKVTIFGSARTLPSDPLYAQAREVAHTLAQQGWMVVTGAGPGIMAAGLEGAGRENSMGINITLPFEQSANPFIVGDPKLVTMKYFFTRKLMLVKESDGFILMPGGFGTLDEGFELLTLVQTGKAEPNPIVMLDVPNGQYWTQWEDFIDKVAARGYIASADRGLYRITDSPREAADEVLHFYRNYHSRRYVNNNLIIRLQSAPTSDELASLSNEFSDIIDGDITATDPLPSERRSNDTLDLPRIKLHFDKVHHGRLRALIDALNELPSAPQGTPEPRHYSEEVVPPPAI